MAFGRWKRLFRVSVLCFFCACSVFFVYRFYVFRAVFRSFLNIGFAFFVYGFRIFSCAAFVFFVCQFCVFLVLVFTFFCSGPELFVYGFAFLVCRERHMSAVILCFACIRRHRMYERQDSSRRLGIGKVRASLHT